MKHYTMQEASTALGVDANTLQSWLATIPHEAYTDPYDHQLYVLDEDQLERIASEHNLPIRLAQEGQSRATALNEPEIHSFPLESPTVSIGRFSDNNIILNHPQVSGHHARLEMMQSGSYRIVDLNSTNGIYVNMSRVKSALLNPGDNLFIGPYKFIFTGNQLIQQDDSYSIRLDAIHLTSRGNRHTLLLDDLSIDIPARTFVALVGSSGVGKTTLLNALSGVQPAQKGRVLYNGQDYYHNLGAFSTQIGYVPQDDIVHNDLTVQQALYYTARMRLPKDFSRSQIRRRIDEVLDEVEITYRRKHLVRSLSGGERKRVSIAIELLANPRIFFLDEPTSGLDPGLDRKMMSLLRKLTDKGHTIVLVTHATTNIHFCDFVCFLAQGGRLAFYGPPAEAQTYFGTNDYAEIYNSLDPTPDNKVTPKKIEERFKNSPYYQRYVLEPLNRELAEPQFAAETRLLIQRPRRGHPWKQFSLLTRRYWRLLLHDGGNFMLLLLQAPIIGLILFYLALPGTFSSTSVATCPLRANPLDTNGPIATLDCQRVVDLLNSPQGSLFAQKQGQSKQQLLENAIEPNSGANAQTLLFIMAFAAILFGCLNGIRSIVREDAIYRRERMVNLGIVPYMFSKIVVLGLFCLFQSAVLIYFVNLKTPILGGIFLPVLAEVYITLVLTSIAGLMMGLAISALAPNSDRAMSFVPIVLIPQVIFSGIIFTLNTPILQWLGALFPMRWAMAALGSSIGLHADKLGVDNFAYQGVRFFSLDPATARPGAMTHLLICWGALLIITIILMFAIGYFLKRKDVRA